MTMNDKIEKYQIRQVILNKLVKYNVLINYESTFYEYGQFLHFNSIISV